MWNRSILILMVGMVFQFGLGCSNGDSVGETGTNLEAACAEDVLELEDGDWLCPDDSSVECEDGGAKPELIYLVPSGELPASCDEIELSLNDEGPFGVGTHDIVVTASASVEGGEPVELTCESILTVKDTVAPVANDEPIALWPPNHKYQTISGDDCVKDACDTDLRVTFHSASSDEPVNDKGDGNTEPDIILECDRVQVRSERQGGSNGRVYKLGWKAVDDSGNETAGECVVTVPHDQSGREAVDDGPAYEIALEPEACDDGSGGTGGAGGAGGVEIP
jgi:hypothetical protein